MEKFNEVLLEVWREACRHIEIHDSGGRIARLLAKHLPLAYLLVRRFDEQHQTINTVAVGQPRGTASPTLEQSVSKPDRWKRVLGWANRNEILEGNASSRSGESVAVVPGEIQGEFLVGPLSINDVPIGVLVLVAESGESFQKSHKQMLRALLEPFSAALENDRRLHELAALREAAEADRRSLLTRLGKQEINEAVIGAETGLRHVMERVELVASSDVPVLILGDTGTGKEVVSRAIHTRSPRTKRPFIRVNCGAIPPELIDSQLFGHEKGSFTGAADTRSGWFERADGGTLFLDEIGELPLPAQVRLLRVLQDGYIERVGGHQPIRVDVRIVAATHRDLATMVTSGSFREDLWYRVNVFPILLPRLRERLEDIPALARHFAQRAAERFGLSYVEPSSADLQLMMNYTWPGNIRELGAVIDRATLLGEGKRLDVAKSLGIGRTVPSPVTVGPTFYEVIPEATQPIAVSETPEVIPLNAAMKQHIERALVAAHGQIEGKHGAAAVLKINPHTLRARMRKLGVRWESFRIAR